MAMHGNDLLLGFPDDQDVYHRCQFCGTSNGKVSHLSGEHCDRLQDLCALRSLTTELQQEANELIQKASQKAQKTCAMNALARFHKERHKDQEKLASRVDTECVLLAEESLLLRQEKETLTQLRQRRERLIAEREMTETIMDTLSYNLHQFVKPILIHRWRMAERLFRMIPIEAEFPGSKRDPQRSMSLTGSSQILGLPILNSGKYDGVPYELLAAALAHTAHLVDSVATVLNIPLDHPLKPFESHECTISPPWSHAVGIPLNAAIHQRNMTTSAGNETVLFAPFAASWRYSLPNEATASYKTTSVGQGPLTNNTLSETTKLPSHHHHQQQRDQPKQQQKNHPPHEPSSLHLLSGPSSSFPSSLENPTVNWIPNEHFALALALFRANIVTLCLRAGLPATELWPPEAFLLNLKLLHERCILMCQQHQEQQPERGLGRGPGVGSDLQHPHTSPTLSDLTHRYLSTRTNHNKGASGVSSSSSPSLSSSKSIATNHSPSRTISKSTLGLSATGQENAGSFIFHDEDDDDYEDEFYEYR